MKRFTSIFVLLYFIAFSASFANNINIGKGEEVRKVSKFNKIEVSGAFEVNIQVGKSQHLEIEASDKYLNDLRTEVRGNTLVIEMKTIDNIKSKIKIDIDVNELYSIQSSGANKIYIDNLENEKFNLSSSGACKLKVTGKSDDFIVQMSGACHLEAFDLSAQNVKVDASGACHLEVNADKHLEVEGSGAVKVNFTGNAKIESDLSGVASISRR